MLERSLAAQCLVHYLVQVSSRDRQQYVTTIADHIISVIRALANGTESQMAHVNLYRQALAPLDRLPSHPAWPFLSFVILLTWKSSDAAGIFLDRGFIRDVHKLSRRYTDTAHSNSLHSMYSSLISTSAMHSLSVSSMKRFVVSHSEIDVEQVLQDGGFTGPAQATGAGARMHWTETRSTSSLPSARFTMSNPPTRSSSNEMPIRTSIRSHSLVRSAY